MLAASLFDRLRHCVDPVARQLALMLPEQVSVPERNATAVPWDRTRAMRGNSSAMTGTLEGNRRVGNRIRYPGDFT